MRESSGRRPAPHTRWSVWRMEERVGVSPARVQRVWQRAGLMPHLPERQIETREPGFEENAAPHP